MILSSTGPLQPQLQHILNKAHIEEVLLHQTHTGTFCPVGIFSSVLIQTLWNFGYVLYSMLWTHYSIFFWAKLLRGRWRNLSCCHTHHRCHRNLNVKHANDMANAANLCNLCHMWCVTMMWLGRRRVRTVQPMCGVSTQTPDEAG